MKRFFSIPVLCFLVSLAFAQTQVNFKKEINRINSLIENKKFSLADTSLILLKNSLENSSLLDEDTVLLYFTSNMALVNYQLGNCEKTIKYSKEDQLLKQEVYGEGDLITLTASRNLGVYYLNCDSIELAKYVLEETLALHKKNFSSPDEIYIRTLDDLAFTYSKLEENEKALESYDRLIGVLGETKGTFFIHVIENYSAFLMSQEKYEQAGLYFEDLKSSMSLREEYLTFLRDYYNVFVHLKDYVRALETASSIATLCQEKNNLCQSLGIDSKQFILSSARLSMLLSQYDAAAGYYNLAEVKFSDNPTEYIAVLSEEAELFELSGKKNLQQAKLNISIDIHRKYGLTDSASFTHTVLRLGKLYTEIGQFKKADELFSNYIRDLEGKGDSANPLQLAVAYQSLGNQRYFLQNLKDTDFYLAKARDLLISKGLINTNEYASVLNSLGALYEGLANYDGAESSYRKALSIVSDASSRLRISLASNLANILILVEPNNDSIDVLLNQAIKWQVELTGENHPTYANMLGSRGVYYQNNEKYDTAEKDFNKAIRIFKYTVKEDHPQYLSALSNLGLLYDQIDRKEEALKIMLQAKERYEKSYSKTHPGFILTLNNLSNLYTELEKYEEAEALLMELATIQVKEISESFSYLSESEKKKFVKEKQKLLDNFKGYVVARTVNEEGSVKPEVLTKWYDLELSTKGMLLNSTKKVRDQIFSSGDDELVRLFSDWTAARKQIADIKSLKNEKKVVNQFVIDSLIEKTNTLEKEISRRSSKFSESFANSAPSFSQISQSLSSTEASVEIIRTQIEGDALYVALIGISGSDAPKIFVIGKGEELEKRSFRGYKNMITFKVDDKSAFESYWKEIHSYLKEKRITKIYYAPDGVYHKISLVTLFNPDTKKYLLDELEIVQVTSTKDLLDIKKEPTTTTPRVSKVLLVGRPSYTIGSLPKSTNASETRGIGLDGITDLPGTEEEINEIGQVLKKNGVTCEIRLQDDASEQEIKKLLNSELVHIATHGFFNDKASENNGDFDPMINSGLLLAGVNNEDRESDEDGILTAYEIMNMELSNVDMIVLSACETALGEIASGEGIYGLQRAFFVGGAKTLIMSLWKVDDQATKELMTSFYKEYMKKGDKREAFINAQQKIKKKYKSPVFWGAFVMLGV